MHVRVSIITGASDVDAGVAFLAEHAVPEMRRQKGFAGLTASGDRVTGKVNVLSMWVSEADLDASESSADKARSDALRVMGGEVAVERYEQMVWETGAMLPGPGAKLHILYTRMDPGRIDENAAYFRSTILPEIRSAPGFLAVRQVMNRRSGQGGVATFWTDEASVRARQERAEARRADARDRGVEFVGTETLDLLFAELRL